MFAKKTLFRFAQAVKSKQYAIVPLSLQQKDSTLKFIQEQFMTSQPSSMAFYRQFPQQKEKSYLYWDSVNKLYGRELFKRGLSFGCFHQQNGKEMIGAILSKDYIYRLHNDPSAEEGTFLYGALRLKQKMLSSVIPEYYPLLNRIQGEYAPVIEMWLAAVHPQYRNKGLLRQMMLVFEQECAKKRYRYIFSWATNIGTAMCYQKLGYCKIAEVNVKEFEHKGLKYFKQLEWEQRNQSFWIKSLIYNPCN